MSSVVEATCAKLVALVGTTGALDWTVSGGGKECHSAKVRGELQAPEMTQRNPTPTTSTTTPLRPPSTVQRHAPSVTAANTISHSIGNTVPVQRAQSPLARQGSGVGEQSAPSLINMSSAPMKGTNIAAPAKAPVRGANGTIRSPFSVGASGVAARKGSPLPRQQTSTTPVAKREVVSSGYGYGAIATNRTSRPNSPAPQQTAATSGSSLGRYGPSTTINSPFIQRGSMSSRPQSPTQQRAANTYGIANNSTSSTTGTTGGVVRRAMSPRPSTQTLGGSSSVISGSAGASTIQPAIRRTNSPTARTRIGSGASAYPAYTTPQATGSRPSSPLQRTPTGPQAASSQLGIRPNSPSRRASGGSLAEQYLAGQHPPSATGSGVTRGMPNTANTNPGSTQVAFGSAVRRNSPTTVVRRY